MPGRSLQTAAAGAVLAISLPMVAFALFTSLVALLILTVRASVLSSEFWFSVIVESWNQKPASPIAPVITKQQPSLEFRRISRTNSFSDPRTSSLGTPRVDFEGVGGWRTDAENHSLWTNMNSRLDQTRSSTRHHKRSVTGGSSQSTALNSPELFPMAMRTPRNRPSTSGRTSPQSYFSLNLPTSRSMVSLQPKRLSGNSSDKWDLSRPESMELEREAEQLGLAI